MNEATPTVAGDELLRTVDDGICHITLNRPAALNALTVPMVRALTDAVRACDDPQVRAVVIGGTGRAFSSGADLREGPPPGDPALIDAVNEAVTAIRTLPRPVVAGVHGPAAGVGCSLALACDLVYAAESAYLLFAFTQVGLMPDGGASLLLPAAVGRIRAAELLLLADRVPTRQAARWGLINDVVPDSELAEHVGETAARLAQGPTRAYAATKDALHKASLSLLEQQLQLERDGQVELMHSEDFTAALDAFADRRRPVFTGR